MATKPRRRKKELGIDAMVDWFQSKKYHQLGYDRDKDGPSSKKTTYVNNVKTPKDTDKDKPDVAPCASARKYREERISAPMLRRELTFFLPNSWERVPEETRAKDLIKISPKPQKISNYTVRTDVERFCTVKRCKPCYEDV